MIFTGYVFRRNVLFVQAKINGTFHPVGKIQIFPDRSNAGDQIHVGCRAVDHNGFYIHVDVIVFAEEVIVVADISVERIIWVKHRLPFS